MNSNKHTHTFGLASHLVFFCSFSRIMRIIRWLLYHLNVGRNSCFHLLMCCSRISFNDSFVNEMCHLFDGLSLQFACLHDRRSTHQRHILTALASQLLHCSMFVYSVYIVSSLLLDIYIYILAIGQLVIVVECMQCTKPYTMFTCR